MFSMLETLLARLEIERQADDCTGEGLFNEVGRTA
jgi:hypothetical protein